MLSRLTRHIATLIAAVVGILGTVGVLYAWGLPPFANDARLTEDAYVRGTVTFLAPQVSGAVVEVAVNDYEDVEAGQLLVRLDDSLYAQRLAQAKAQFDSANAGLASARQERLAAEAKVESADAGVQSARAALEVSKDERDRTAELRNRNVVTERDAQNQQLAFDQAQAVLLQAEAQAATARQDVELVAVEREARAAAVEEARAAVNLARLDLEHTRIVAPMDGKLGEISARVGEYVAPGTRLASLVPERKWIVANFKETELAGMEVGDPITFSVDALGEAALTGRIENFSPATGSEFSVLGSSNATGNFIKISRRLPVRIAIDPDQPLVERLVPGMSVVVRVDLDDAEL
ncbi:HlyD family secretion protein [Paracoccus sp. TK19116]|uniref:HlyD family secretion protein n=1 Tax=Paracoccus albicereus TaxID=2922394 RepID=A0ABT1MRZ8_9RHOB|nr:HlyD family secretion protein [Paracoccus albicereus]MCQ0970504.1 HlyD family secretion protein [Paracoccus albicereus]